MAPGTELSNAAIAALSRRDVTEVWVIDSQTPTTDVHGQEAALRQHHQERLARLFRHVGEGADDRYLCDLMARYRGVDPL